MLVAKTIIIDYSCNVLFLVRSSTHPRYPNEADLPGGIIEQNERIADAVVREVKEECGIVFNPNSVKKVDEMELNQKWKYYLTVIVADKVSPELSWEHNNYFICNIDNIEEQIVLKKVRDPYMKFAVKSIIRNRQRLKKWVNTLSK